MTIAETARRLIERISGKAPLHVVICGGGASAALLTQALARRTDRPIRITIVERNEKVAPGLAYATTCASHLLNVRAGRMSIDSGEADHFVHWLNRQYPKQNGSWQRDNYIQRFLYGLYLQEELSALVNRKSGLCQISIERATAQALVRHGKTWRVRLSEGRLLPADVVVIATGNDPPRPLLSPSGDRAIGQLMIENPWDDKAKAALPKTATILLVGVALTAVDIALELIDGGHLGPIFAISRRGLLPLSHLPSSSVTEPWLKPPYPQSLSLLVSAIRHHIQATAGPWQNEIDALRPIIPDLWAALEYQERRRFLRHVQPYWDIHRHRVAPAVHERLAAALKQRRVIPLKGRLGRVEFDACGGVLRAEVRSREQSQYLLVNRIVNCTGLRGDPRSSDNVLIRSLLKNGFARPDSLSLGLDVDEQSHLVAADGRIHQSLFVLGPLTRGRWWEVIAVPEIRTRAVQLARTILEHSRA